MINLTLNSSGPASQAAPVAAGNGAPAAPQDAGAVLPFAGGSFVAPSFEARPFADLLGQLDLAGAVDSADAPVDGDSAAGPVPAADDGEGGHGDDSAAGQQPILTAAMTMVMPLLPAAPAAANAVANAVAAATASGPKKDVETPRAAPAAAIATAAPAAAIPAVPIPAAAAMALPPIAEQAPRATPTALPVTDAAAGTAQVSAASTPRAFAASVPAGADSDLAAKIDATPARDSAGVNGATLAAPVPAAQRDGGADTVALPGPPAAWRQSLREALGERLQMQAGRGLEQAVIRLDPPQLGRVEIAIRHSAGSLEVTLSATHGEVLRQLHAVSDNLRSDLAQRQYTEVAVTVTPAPRNAAANPFGADAQGRGRQGGRDQEQQAPGLALFDDGPAASGFSLTGRE
jgi:flagellar hook-length control protein FliK